MEGHARQLRRVENPRSGTAKYGVLFAASFNREGRPHDRLFGLARHLLLLITAFGHACRQCRVPVDDPADHGRVRIETMRRCISSHAMERPCRTGQCCQSLPRAKSPHLARGRGSLGWRRPLHAQTVPSPGRSPSRWQTGHSGRAKGRSARRLVGRRHPPPDQGRSGPQSVMHPAKRPLALGGCKEMQRPEACLAAAYRLPAPGVWRRCLRSAVSGAGTAHGSAHRSGP